MKKYILVVSMMIVMVFGVGIATYALWDTRSASLDVNTLKSAFNVKVSTTTTKSNETKKLIPKTNQDGSVITPNSKEINEYQLGTFKFDLSTDADNVDIDSLKNKVVVSIASIIVTNSSGVQSVLFTVDIRNSENTVIGRVVNNGGYVIQNGNANDLVSGKNYSAYIYFSSGSNSNDALKSFTGMKVTINLVCTAR